MTDPDLVAKKLAQIRDYGYDTVDLDVVRDVLARHLDDLLEFASAVESRVRAGD